MKVSKSQLTNGIVNFLQTEVVRNVPDATVKVALGSLVFAFRNNPALLDGYLFRNPMISALLMEQDGTYDVDLVVESVKASIHEYGNLIFTFPVIPLVSKEEKTLSFSATDVDTLKSYIERSVN